MRRYFINIKFLVLFCLSLTIIGSFEASNANFGVASYYNSGSTSIESVELANITSSTNNATGIVLVHGAGDDGSSWSI